MSTPDATAIAELIRRVRVVDPFRLDDCLQEMPPGATGADLTRQLERKGLITSYQSSKLLKCDREGYFIGGYRILYRIASGSFGRVFRADDPATGTVVAVKVLRNRMSDKPHMVELFQREGKIGLTLQHPNIVRILAVGKDAQTGQHYIAMDFVEGGNLRDILRIRNKLGTVEAVKIMEECASGLAYAMSRGMMHRDMKTTNVLMSSTGVSKLVDFGLTALAGEAAEEDETEVERTVDYAALERATNQKGADPRSDIFFLGCVFYELLTGRRPVPPTKDKLLLRSPTRYSQIPPIVAGEVDAPPSVFKLLDRMLAFNPNERFQSAAQLHEAIRRVQNELEGHGNEVIAPSGPRTIFVVEGNERIQDAMREKLKSLGFRVLISHDPVRAELRYKEQPYHCLVIDAGTAGEDGLASFKRIVRQADDNGLQLAAVLLLNEEQADWANEIPGHSGVGTLVRPLNLRQLHLKLQELSGEPVTP